MNWKIWLAKIGIRYFLKSQTASRLLTKMVKTVKRLDVFADALTAEAITLEEKIAKLTAQKMQIEQEAKKSKVIAKNLKKLKEVA